MCTAISLTTQDHYFGRNLDLEYSYTESITITPRNFPFSFRQKKAISQHYAMIGTAFVQDNYPLYYDATNEKGLSMAGLNFPENAYYFPPEEDKDNITPYEFIPWILGQCATVSEARMLLDKIDIEKGVVVIEGVEHPLLDKDFPTIDWNNPYALSKEEEEVINRLVYAFRNSEKLQKHAKFLYTKGSMYTVHNGNLLYHGCVPLNDDGTFKKVSVFGKEYSGKELYDVLEGYARKGYYATDPDEKQKGLRHRV